MLLVKRIEEAYHDLNNVLFLEVSYNKSVEELRSYLKQKELEFCRIEEQKDVKDLAEFIRGANRYSDEFEFSNLYRTEIKRCFYNLYELLNLKQNEIENNC